MLRAALEAQAPPKQNATDTINTLSGRLASATLLEDRRAAIQGLRSFAKEYPASVASGALRGLISELQKDVEDVDTEKVVLETLLMLFNPNVDSPEASEDIALWLADEFSQRQDNITILLDLLDTPDFYSRLYALQLLTAISASRPERTQDCILSAPLGTTRLVAVLDDAREAVRAAGLLLLNEVTQGSVELQKLVAFENAFDRVFNLIQADGSLAYGDIIVQDCLSLLANLLHLNAANQSLFRETGFVARLAKLLADDGSSPNNEPLPGPDTTREKNIWGLLAVLKMFLIPSNLGTPANQAAFEKQGVLQQVLNVSFDTTISPRIRAEALHTCADMIRGGGAIQERFAHNKVRGSQQESETNGNVRKSLEKGKVYVIEELLNVALTNPSVVMFDVRYAACSCIQAYFYNHKGIRHHFLTRAIEGHRSGKEEPNNVLTILIGGLSSYDVRDPYRLWFAARIMFDLISDDLQAKQMAMAVVEGDAENGEEVVTCIQSLAANLMTSLQSAEDERVCIGYLMVLCGWLFEDSSAVNDFLSEGSLVQSMIQVILRKDKGRELVQGLCTSLLGIIYEFSTKDSPISRRTLQPMLMTGLSREHYVAKIKRLREDPAMRDFEVLPQNLSSVESGELPLVFFDQDFVNFIKDNFSRIIRAIDRDPGKEIVHAEQGIDRDIFDDLRTQIEDKKQAIQKAENDYLAMEQKYNQEQADHRRAVETSSAEVARIKNINEALQMSHDREAQKMEAAHKSAVQDMRLQHRKQLDDVEKRVQQVTGEVAMRTQATAQQHGVEVAGFRRRVQDLETIGTQSKQKLEALQRSLDGANDSIRSRDAQLAALRNDVQQRDSQITALRKQMLEKDAQMEVLREDITASDSKVEQMTLVSSQKNERIDSLEKENKRLEASVARITTLNQELEATAKENSDRTSQASTRETSLKILNSEIMSRQKELQSRIKTLETAEKKFKKDLEDKEVARQAAQTELDDLLILLSDLEDKRSKDKKKLKELGAEISDDDDNDDDDDEDDGGGDGAEEDEENAQH